MELIERYIYAVTEKLPQMQRKDIAVELRGLIEDMLEERGGKGNWNKEDVEAVLLELGNPRKLADNYRGKKKFLIGPELFDSFVLISKIIIISFVVAIGSVFFIQSILNPFSVLEYFIDMIVSLVTGIPMAFGWITFVFALAEYFGVNNQKDLLGTEWHPSLLPPIPDKKRKIKRCEPIAGIVFYSIFLIFFAFSSEYFGIWVFRDEFTGVVSFLNVETYGTYLLPIILVFGFGILKECLKLIWGKWTYKLVTFTVVANVISMAVILLMINGPDFWNPMFLNELVDAGLVVAGSDNYQIISNIWEQSTFWILVLLVFGLIWDVIDGFIRARKK